MSLTTDYANQQSVHDVMALKSVHDVVALNTYAKGIKITDAEMAALGLHKNDFHGEWNYTLNPVRN